MGPSEKTVVTADAEGVFEVEALPPDSYVPDTQAAQEYQLKGDNLVDGRLIGLDFGVT